MFLTVQARVLSSLIFILTHQVKSMPGIGVGGGQDAGLHMVLAMSQTVSHRTGATRTATIGQGVGDGVVGGIGTFAGEDAG